MATRVMKLGGDEDTIVVAVVSYDPANEATFPDGSSDITACDLISVQVTVAGVGPVTIAIWRKQGNSRVPWREATLAAGVYTYDAGGPVQTFGDIALWQVVT